MDRRIAAQQRFVNELRRDRAEFAELLLGGAGWALIPGGVAPALLLGAVSTGLALLQIQPL
jgi:hypothetical protein